MSLSDLDLDIKETVYAFFVREERAPRWQEVAKETGLGREELRRCYQSLRREKLLVLEGDGLGIRMAPPFSGVPTQHVAAIDGRRYFANCAWDVLGVLAAISRPGLALSRCEQTLEPLELAVSPEGPEPSGWLFHCPLPAATWWDDVVLT